MPLKIPRLRCCFAFLVMATYPWYALFLETLAPCIQGILSGITLYTAVIPGRPGSVDIRGNPRPRRLHPSTCLPKKKVRPLPRRVCYAAYLVQPGFRKSSASWAMLTLSGAWARRH
jgi:hypothetical protein